jgi:hypothetical protein
MRCTIRPAHRFPASCPAAPDTGPFFPLTPVCLSWLWLPVALLLLSSRPLYAEWVAVENSYQEPGRQTVYADPATVRREGNPATLWQLTDYRWMQGNPKGTPPFLSTKTRKQFDCAGKRVRLPAFTEYAGHMATGMGANGSVDPSVWLPVESGSINHTLWNAACDKG